MQPIILEHLSRTGELLKAVFLPEKGMNLISFKRGDIEIIEQSTLSIFEERYAGLGALIGPHFHRRKTDTLPKIKDESLFPHIARVKAKGVEDPFSHGIARYASWKAESTQTDFKATLSGKDTWNGVPLAELEGQNFKMIFSGKLSEQGLSLDLSIVSDTDSLVGIHYYYALPNGQGRITAQAKKHETMNAKPGYLNINEKRQVVIELKSDMAIDETFHAYPNPKGSIITLETSAYTLKTTYSCICEENCWQLYHPAASNFVCIEPISSQDPRHPNLSVSALHIDLEIISSI